MERPSFGLTAERRQRNTLASARGEAIRLAPHYFNTEGEIDAALDALVEVQR